MAKSKTVLLGGLEVDSVLGPSIEVCLNTPIDLILEIERNFKTPEDAVRLLNTLIYAQRLGYEIELNQTRKQAEK